MWKGCLTSIAQRCKRLRNPHRKRSSAAMTASNDGEGPPSMALGKDLQYDKCENPQAESDDEDEEYDMDNLDRPSSCHTPPVLRVSSDSEQEDSHISPRDVLPGNDNSDICNLKQSEDSSARPESTFDSSKEADDKEQDVHVPPGIDPNITVVYLPSTLQTALQPREADKRPSSALLQANGADSNVRLKESENVSAQIVHIQEPYEHKRDSVSPVHNLPVACKYYGDHPPVEGNIYKPGPLTAENVIVSGIKMSPDCKFLCITHT